MKKEYIYPELEIIAIDATDVITTSPDAPFVDGDDLFEDGL